MCEPTACLEHEGGLVVGVDDVSVSHWLVLSVQPAAEEENNSTQVMKIEIMFTLLPGYTLNSLGTYSSGTSCLR